MGEVEGRVSEGEWKEAGEDSEALGESPEGLEQFVSPDAASQAEALDLPFEEQEFSSFDQQWMEEFEGLAYLGYLEDVINLPGHVIRIKTLKDGEKKQVIRMCIPFETSVSYGVAYRAAWVAAAIKTVDGMPIPVPEKGVEVIEQRVKWLDENWHDALIEVLYNRCDWLEGRVVQILEHMGVLNERRLVTRLPEPS